jgi:signal transduction histidine kinase
MLMHAGRWIPTLAAMGVLPSDSTEIRRQKRILTLTAGLKASVCPVWYGTYVVLGLPVAAAIPLVYQILTVASLIRFAQTKRFATFRFREALLILLLPVFLHWALGGFVASSGVIVWAFLAPLTAVLFHGMRQSRPWFGAFLLLLVVSGLADAFVAERAAPVPQGVIIAFFVLNIGTVSAITFAAMQYFAHQVQREQAAQQHLNSELRRQSDELATAFARLEEQGAELATANRHKSEFLAAMSHELRTPLNAIIGYTELLEDEAQDAHQDVFIPDLRKIHLAATHLLSLINDILDLSKVEAGRMDLEVSTFPFTPMLESALSLVRERAGRNGITLSLEVDPAIRTVAADERKLKQVVVNLLTNAVKFTPAGGEVAITAHQSAAELTIAVRDTGIGIAPDDQAHIFEEFRQARHSSARTQEGTGLGLPLAKKFVELHGGRMWVESAPGAGSTFTFTLPVRAQSAPAPAADIIAEAAVAD